ncbi:PC4/YdbC family ssDNA-binding protein [uncultured Phenylobacterium sp.]|uniref:PC4/YdbC family ssDNA-binding protein n=1 Tax=uncultured Phenylobacterium sp. TaxID=349273 RepID=UPI0025F64255|nr:PC4/YdbC family ssDNA-binding protein [uncultured Phenylobacterium sp.]
MSDALPVVIRSLPLGAKTELRLTLDSFNGNVRLDLRTWCDYALGPAQVRGPTKRGVSVPVGAIPDLAAAVREAEAQARAHGLLLEGGVGTP